MGHPARTLPDAKGIARLDKIIGSDRNVGLDIHLCMLTTLPMVGFNSL
jgi:hypothetical protein